MSPALSLVALTGIPEVQQRHDIAVLLRDALHRADLRLQEGDVLVVSSKIVSKAQGLRIAHGDTARERDGVVRAHATRVVAERATPTGITRIVAASAGPVLAASGVDASNTGPQGGSLALPTDPDLVAREVYAGLLSAYAPLPLPRIGILISDTAGRPWRDGQVDFALGACGIEVLDDLRGGQDADGRALKVTARAVADEIAAAADLVKGKTEGIPAVLVRGLAPRSVTSPAAAGARSLVRDAASDWFTLGTAEAVRASLGAPPGGPTADAVGVAAAGPEREEVRMERALALACCHGSTPRAPDEIRVRGKLVEVLVAEPYHRGRLVARIEVALHSEGLNAYRVEPVTASAGDPVAPAADRASAG